MITSVIHDSTEYVVSPVLLEPYSGNHPSSCGGTHNTAFPLALASIGSPLTGGYSVNTVCSSPSDCGRWYTVCGVGDWSVTLYHGSDLWGAYGYKAWTRISNTGVEQSDDGVTWGPSSITTLSSHYLCAPITTIQGDITNPVSCS